MLASFPASMLNQKPSDLGILNRLKLDPSRSRIRRPREGFGSLVRITYIDASQLKEMNAPWCSE
jgi:hypothetical protein